MIRECIRTHSHTRPDNSRHEHKHTILTLLLQSAMFCGTFYPSNIKMNELRTKSKRERVKKNVCVQAINYWSKPPLLVMCARLCWWNMKMHMQKFIFSRCIPKLLHNQKLFCLAAATALLSGLIKAVTFLRFISETNSIDKKLLFKHVMTANG